MAKNIIPPDPIPVKELDCEIPVGCTMFTNYPGAGYSSVVEKIITYLYDKYQNATYPSNQLYEIPNMAEDECREMLLNDIDDITPEDIRSHVVFIPGHSDNSCLVSVF